MPSSAQARLAQFALLLPLDQDGGHGEQRDGQDGDDDEGDQVDAKPPGAGPRRGGRRPHRRMRSSGSADREAAKMSQTAMNIAAITGPITKPLMPKIARPPSVVISTT